MPRKILSTAEKIEKEIEKGRFDPMEEITKCPICHNDVKEGERIWLDGQATCFDCYVERYRKHYGVPYKWDKEGNLLPEYQKEDN